MVGLVAASAPRRLAKSQSRSISLSTVLDCTLRAATLASIGAARSQGVCRAVRRSQRSDISKRRKSHGARGSAALALDFRRDAQALRRLFTVAQGDDAPRLVRRLLGLNLMNPFKRILVAT